MKRITLLVDATVLAIQSYGNDAGMGLAVSVFDVMESIGRTATP